MSYSVYNVKNYGAKGDGSTDDTSAIQAAIGELLQSQYSAMLYFPPGAYKVTDTLQFEAMTGVVIAGAGAQIDVLAGWNSASAGTRIVASGMSEKPIFDFYGVNQVSMRDLTVWGNIDSDRDPGAQYGMRVRQKEYYGGGHIFVQNVGIFCCQQGVNCGNSSDEAYNAEDCTFIQCKFNSCAVGFKAEHFQALNFGFYDCEVFGIRDLDGHPSIPTDAFRLTGGNIALVNFASYDIDRLIVVEDSGPNIGHATVVNARIDGDTKRTVVYEVESSVSAVSKATFIDVQQTSTGPGHPPSGGARFKLRNGAVCKVIGGANLCGADGPLFYVDATSAIFVEGALIDADQSHVIEGGTTGAYSVRGCFDQASGGFVPDYGAGVALDATYLLKSSDPELPAGRVVNDSTSVTADWSTAGQVSFKRAALTGDVKAPANDNSTTISSGVVTLSKMADLATDRLIGRDTAGTGAPEALTVGGGLEFTGSGGIQVANNGVTYAKMQDVSASQRVIGRKSAGSGDPEEVSAPELLEWMGGTQGQVLYRGASAWTTLPIGTSGGLLYSTGTSPAYSGNLTWDNANSFLIVGGSTAANADKGTITTEQVSGHPGILITGAGTDGVGDSAHGVALFMTHNSSGNRQFCVSCSENFGQINKAVVRFMTGNNIASIDAIEGDGSDTCPLNLGSDTTGVIIGNGSAAYNYAVGAKLKLFGEASKAGLITVNNATTPGNPIECRASDDSTVNALIDSAGNIKAAVAGAGFYVKEGSNATMGTTTLTGGAASVTTSKLTANSRIFLTVQSLGTVGTPQAVAVTSRSGSTFNITSASASDTSKVAWVIIEPA